MNKTEPRPLDDHEFGSFLAQTREDNACVILEYQHPVVRMHRWEFAMSPTQARLLAVHLLNFAEAIDGFIVSIE
jgi:hypothetical protein